MNKLLSILTKINVYLHYFWNYLKFGEITCLYNSIYYLTFKQSNAPGGIVKSAMGLFYTRPETLDFQYVNYAYELKIKKFIKNQIFDVFIDAGACIGEYSIWIAKMGIRCYAFEPVTSSCEIIKQNVKLNQLENLVTVFNYGLGKQHEIDFFQINPVNYGASKKVESHEPGADRFEINAFDDIYQNLNIPTNSKILFKIDVEGMETDLFSGATKFIQTYPNLVFIIEEKHTGEAKIKELLNSLARFEYEKIDSFNFYALKLPSG